MSRIELFQRQPENEIDPNTGSDVVGFGFGLRDTATGSPVPEGDPSLAPQGIRIVDLIALDRYPHAAQDPAFDPGHVLALIPDHNQGGAVGVWNEARNVQVGWLPGTAATVVNEALAQGWSQHAVALWAQRTPGNVRTGLRIAVSTEVLTAAGQVAGPPPSSAPPPSPAPVAPPAPATPTAAPPETRRGKGAVWAVTAVIVALVIAAGVYFAFFRGGSEPEPTTTTQEQVTTTTESPTTAPPTLPTTAPPTAPPPTVPPPTAPPPTEPPPTEPPPP